VGRKRKKAYIALRLERSTRGSGAGVLRAGVGIYEVNWWWGEAGRRLGCTV